MAADFGRRFDELDQQAANIDSAKRIAAPQYGVSGFAIDSKDLLNWTVKARHLIAAVCGDKSQHFLLFVENEKPGLYVTDYDIFQRVRTVFLAAKEDYEGGYLNKIRDLIQADVF